MGRLTMTTIRILFKLFKHQMKMMSHLTSQTISRSWMQDWAKNPPGLLVNCKQETSTTWPTLRLISDLLNLKKIPKNPSLLEKIDRRHLWDLCGKLWRHLSPPEH